MKIKFINKLIDRFKKYLEHKNIKEKLKLRKESDKTSKFRDMDFLD